MKYLLITLCLISFSVHAQCPTTPVIGINNLVEESPVGSGIFIPICDVNNETERQRILDTEIAPGEEVKSSSLNLKYAAVNAAISALTPQTQEPSVLISQTDGGYYATVYSLGRSANPLTESLGQTFQYQGNYSITSIIKGIRLYNFPVANLKILLWDSSSKNTLLGESSIVTIDGDQRNVLLEREFNFTSPIQIDSSINPEPYFELVVDSFTTLSTTDYIMGISSAASDPYVEGEAYWNGSLTSRDRYFIINGY